MLKIMTEAERSCGSNSSDRLRALAAYITENTDFSFHMAMSETCAWRFARRMFGYEGSQGDPASDLAFLLKISREDATRIYHSTNIGDDRAAAAAMLERYANEYASIPAGWEYAETSVA